MRWLSAPSPSAVAEALRVVAPELSGLPVDLADVTVQDDPQWHAASTALGEEFFVKFAWSEPAARGVLRQISVMEALAREPAVPFLPEVAASGTDPLILVTRRVRGSSLFSVVDSVNRDHAGMQLARFLAALHGQETRQRVEAMTGAVPAWYPLVTTGALRERFGRWVTPEQQREVVRWCDWADEILAGPRPQVLVHGDFHGNNMIWDGGELKAVLDFGNVGSGEPEFELRCFPGPVMGPGLELLTAVMRHYQRFAGRELSVEHVMAWHIRQAFGDVLWRSEAGLPLPDHRAPADWVADMAARFRCLGGPLAELSLSCLRGMARPWTLAALPLGSTSPMGGEQVVSDERMEKELHGTLDSTSFAHLGAEHHGKVRDSYICDGVRTIVTTDRQSAFDRVLGTIPFKGQALNEVANFWFDATCDIVPNHLLEAPDPNVVRARECGLVPLEFVVRAYITGVTKTSLWFNYEQGRREVAGNRLPEGLRKNERLARPILTSTTKLEEHDRNISPADAVSEGLVSQALFDRIASVSFDLFARGTELAAERGLILADTKYEFGLLDDDVVLIDEVHTPDSSRLWYADTYGELFAAGKDQRALDKEPLREWFAERGFRGDGPAPSIPDQVRVATASRYIALAEEITRRPFQATTATASDRVLALLTR